MITLRCVIDNTVLSGSPLWGEHGVAFWIETADGNLLFDTGQSGDVLAHNIEIMQIDLNRCDALALSHAHYDHTGGLAQFFKFSQSGIPLYASPDIFRDRYAIKNGQARSIGLHLTRDDIAQKVHLALSSEPKEILTGVWTSGEIRERNEFEGRSAQHHIRIGETWQPDPYQDDLSLVLQTPQGLVIVCGCCHAGLLNTLKHIQRLFSQPFNAIVGGTHLAKIGLDTMKHVVEELQSLCEGFIPELYLNHCTGDQALAFLFQAFGDKVKPCPAGTVLVFD